MSLHVEYKYAIKPSISRMISYASYPTKLMSIQILNGNFVNGNFVFSDKIKRNPGLVCSTQNQSKFAVLFKIDCFVNYWSLYYSTVWHIFTGNYEKHFFFPHTNNPIEVKLIFLNFLCRSIMKVQNEIYIQFRIQIKQLYVFE